MIFVPLQTKIIVVKRYLILLLPIVFLFSSKQIVAQSNLIQFSGLLMTSDSLKGIPYATVMLKNSSHGTVSNYQGFFSLVAAKGDIIVFSAVGFKTVEFILPDSLSKNKYSVIQLLSIDTIRLPTTVIYPWPTKDQFKQAFLSLNIPDDDLERARRNLEKQRLADLGETLPYDGKETATAYLRNESRKFNYAGQTPPMNIFNPIAWSQFIQAWKNGDFKRKDK